MIMRKKERTNKNILNKNNHLIYKKKLNCIIKIKVLSKIIEIKKNKNSKIKKIGNLSYLCIIGLGTI